MKNIEDLSKTELQSAFMHQFQDVAFADKHFECAACGETEEVLFYYICDKCEGVEPPKVDAVCASCGINTAYLNDTVTECPICGLELEQD